MEPIILVHGYSAESKDTTLDKIAAIYGTLPAYLAREMQDAAGGAPEVVDVNISRYVSLDDGVDLDDLTIALDRVLKTKFPRLLDPAVGFNAIIHSTGALVMRNWVRRCSEPGRDEENRFRCPLKRIVHLAGANFGSGWAHVGESLLAKWGREIVFHEERGLAVLDGLELGSNWSIELHRHFLRPGRALFADYGVMEFCIVGSQIALGPGALTPIRYGKEDGSDGVVRVASANLNHNYLRLGPTRSAVDTNWTVAARFARNVSGGVDEDRAADLPTADLTPEQIAQTLADFKQDQVFAGGHYEVKEDCRPGPAAPDEDGPRTRRLPRVPFAIPYNCAHSSPEIGIVYGSETKDQVRPLLKAALNASPEDYETQLPARFQAVTDAAYELVRKPAHARGILAGLRSVGDALKNEWSRPETQYDPHAQVIVRVRDQNDKPVKDCSIHFNSFGGDNDPRELINGLFEDQHQNKASRNICTFYLRTARWNQTKRDFQDRIAGIHGVDLEIDVVDLNSRVDPALGSRRILFVPLRMRISGAELRRWITPHQTTIIDVNLLRLPAETTFVVLPAGAA